MTDAQMIARHANADRRARDLRPAVRALAPDRWAVESARRDVTYVVRFTVDGARCSCVSGDQGVPCYHVAACLLAVAAQTQPEPPSGGPASYRQCPSCGARHGKRESCAVCRATGMVYAA